MPAKKDGGKGDHDRGAGAGRGAGGRYGGGTKIEGGEGGKGGGCSGGNWGELFADGKKHGGGVGGEDRTGSGNTAGGYESDVDVAERISDWRNKKQGSEHSDSFRPSKDTINSPSYPRFASTNLGRFTARDGMLGKLAFTFFSFMMPAAVVAFLVKEVRAGRYIYARVRRAMAGPFPFFFFFHISPAGFLFAARCVVSLVSTINPSL